VALISMQRVAEGAAEGKRGLRMFDCAWITLALRLRPTRRREPIKGKLTMSDDVLDAFRSSIDNIDAALIHMLAERFKVTQAVGRYKAQAGLPPADPGREDRQIARLRRLAEDAHLDPEFSEKFLRFIIDEVIRHHERLRDGA
jgi:chorismate mutase